MNFFCSLIDQPVTDVSLGELFQLHQHSQVIFNQINKSAANRDKSLEISSDEKEKVSKFK